MNKTLLLAAAALVCAWILLGFYFDQRDSLTEQRDGKSQSMADAIRLLQQESDLRKLTARLGTSVMSDSSAAEGQLLHLVHDWEQRAGANNASFQRVGMSEEHGFVLLTFEVSAAGDMPAIAAFLYQIETASIPLRVENVQMHSKYEGGDEVQIHLEISTLYRSDAARSSGPGAASAPELARGPG
ncbi:MAG TPA: GspMb/PilO family protein [Tepidisphaeraceae bacterium]|nr:GspMb/PilO family protein [Tepidisphaeraceae bacterium]